MADCSPKLLVHLPLQVLQSAAFLFLAQEETLDKHIFLCNVPEG